MQQQLRPGASLEIAFDAFTARLEMRAASQLHLEIIAGDNKGFSDDVGYELHWVTNEVAVLSFEERIGTTVTHVIDFMLMTTYTTVTSDGGFMRLTAAVRLTG